MNEEISFLRKRVAELEYENELLRAKVDFFNQRPWMLQGMRGEKLVAEIIGGFTTAVNESYDVVTRSGGVRIEVKYSRLNRAVKGYDCFRWQWVHVFGFDHNKVFDTLILMGDVDENHRRSYKDPSSPYIFFDVPYSRLPEVTRHGVQMIQITTNPLKARTEAARLLYNDFQITRDELSAKYSNPRTLQ